MQYERHHVCAQLEITLAALNCRAMVVGHTIVRLDGLVRTRCGGRLVLGDTGFAPYYGANRIALEHHANGSFSVVRVGERRDWGELG